MRAVLLALVSAMAASPAMADEYPTALIERPQLLPRGLLQVDAALGHETRRALGVEILSAESSELAVHMGVSERWELGAASSLWLDPDARWNRDLSLAAGFHAFERERIDIAPRLELPLSFRHGYDLVGTAWPGLGLKARLGDRLFAVAGRRWLPIDIRPAFAVHTAVDGGIGFQATPALALLVETQLAMLTLVGPIDRTTWVGDAWPLALTGLWGGGRIDALLEIKAGRVQAPGDDLAIAVRIGVRP